MDERTIQVALPPAAVRHVRQLLKTGLWGGDEGEVVAELALLQLRDMAASEERTRTAMQASLAASMARQDLLDRKGRT